MNSKREVRDSFNNINIGCIVLLEFGEILYKLSFYRKCIVLKELGAIMYTWGFYRNLNGLQDWEWNKKQTDKINKNTGVGFSRGRVSNIQRSLQILIVDSCWNTTHIHVIDFVSAIVYIHTYIHWIEICHYYRDRFVQNF